MSTEQRDVRPFGSVGAFDALLRHALVIVGAESVENGGRLILEEDVFVRSNVVLRLAKDSSVVADAFAAAKADLADLDLTVGDLEFAVVLSSGYLKISEIRHRMPLSELVDAGADLSLSLPTRPLALRSPHSGCAIEVSIHLATEHAQKPLRPWRLGTWLAKAKWEIVTEHTFTGFTPQPLTPEKKREFDLPPKCVRYITLGGVSPLEEGVKEDSVEVWFEADLLGKMSASPKSKPSVALQMQLFLDAISVVVTESRMQEAFDMMSWAEVRDSLLGRVIELVAPSKANELARTAACATYLQIVKDNPARFMAYAEEQVGIAGAYDAGLDG